MVHLLECHQILSFISFVQELVALGEVVGTESRGLSSDTIAALPSRSYKAENMQDDNAEQYAHIPQAYSIVGQYLVC